MEWNKIMNNFKEKLRDYYHLKESIKKYKGYKVKSPDETIQKITESFNLLNLNLNYIPWHNTVLGTFFPFQSGQAYLSPKEDLNKILITSNGKGVTPKLSQASGYAEVIERFSGYGMGSGGLITNYLSQIKLNKIWNKKSKRNSLIKKHFPYHKIDTLDIGNYSNLNLNDKAKSVCYSLSKDNFYSYDEEFLVKLSGSHGLASGNTKEEAILHAIFECIERLSLIYLFDHFPQSSIISTESVTHPTLINLMNAINNVNIKFKMFDFSFLFDIPLIITLFDHDNWFFSNIKYSNSSKQFPNIKVGIDTDPQDAALRCFTEFLQGELPTLEALSNEYKIRHTFSIADLKIPQEFLKYLDTTDMTLKYGNIPISFDGRKYMENKSKEISIQDINSIYDIDNKIEIEKVISILNKHQIEVFVKNITNPLLDFPVVHVFLSGGSNYFSSIPLDKGFAYLLLDYSNIEERLSRLKQIVHRIAKPSRLLTYLKESDWCTNPHQLNLINLIIEDLVLRGISDNLWGVPINPFYLLGLLYLRVNDFNQSLKCLDAASCYNLNDVDILLTKAYICYKLELIKEYQNIIDYVNIIQNNSNNINEYFSKLDDLVISPNPFEICDGNCNQKKEICNNCFFCYVNDSYYLYSYDDRFIEEEHSE